MSAVIGTPFIIIYDFMFFKTEFCSVVQTLVYTTVNLHTGADSCYHTQSFAMHFKSINFNFNFPLYSA